MTAVVLRSAENVIFVIFTGGGQTCGGGGHVEVLDIICSQGSSLLLPPLLVPTILRPVWVPPDELIEGQGPRPLERHRVFTSSTVSNALSSTNIFINVINNLNITWEVEQATLENIHIRSPLEQWLCFWRTLQTYYRHFLYIHLYAVSYFKLIYVKKNT